MSNNKVTIIVPVFNTDKYLFECLESIQNQTYKNFEVILVDDGSRDLSGKICDHFSSIDTRFHCIHTKNYGVSHARNVALEYIQNKETEFITFIDSDDKIDNTYLRHFVSAMNQYQVDYACCANTRFFQNFQKDKELDGSIRHLTSNKEVLLHFTRGGIYYKNPTCFVGSACKVYRKSILQNHRFDEKLPIAEDLDFIFHVLSHVNKGIALHKALYYYRQRKSSLSNQTIKTPKHRHLFLLLQKPIAQHSNIINKFIKNRILSLFWQYILSAFRYSFINHEIYLYAKKEAKRLLCLCSTFKEYKRLFFVLYLPQPLLKTYVLKATKKQNTNLRYFD